MIDFKTIDDLDLGGRTVLVRADLNVPLDGAAVGDDFRIRASLPTITDLRSRGARVVVCSHLGRPEGADPSLSLGPVADRLGELGGFEARLAADVAGPSAAAAVSEQGDSVVVLENTRFERGETGNTPELAAALAALADLFILDAFGSAHRAHASTVGVAERLPSAAGRVLETELAAFDRLLAEPTRPYIVILGGAKVSDKLGVMEALLPKVEAVLVGGAMCFTVLAAEGYDTGDSLVEPEMIDDVQRVLDGPYGSRVALPVDVVAATTAAADADTVIVPSRNIPDGVSGLDIGPETAARFSAIIEGSKTLFWNGPMGMFELPPFATGTREVAEAVARCPGYTVAGGGDSVSALTALGVAGQITHVSTGGGAGLELLEEGTLPGIEALGRWANA